ncbi:putative UBX domain-containing protein 1 [Scophthalmus maximus]|uniref:Putative UBX domain-containing protein 1 n=1 Tax=Scophthalmus maximus TaxID=52904 RepID=A0A2U9CAQ3_SCOMX|nr:UBX domain-containing protein 1 [Scophthalmus maximus]XP_035505735.1 UBX domain-containing protein 1 [Scophthalmus maximus]XP_035505736.1 UBX domain-containing protein 1 [Scophthalmus maximus]AWP11992.1 putative UBX domain-containing protein 1 [Scophthalmus maximus]
MAELTTQESLLEMGFDRNRAEKAVANTGNQGIEQAMDWLMEHENDPDIDEPYVPPVGNVLGGDTESQPSAEQSTQADTTEAGDIAYNEDDENAQPMTEEEKHEQVKRLEELMRVKQAERRERERAEEVEREKQRRRHGQELQQIRQKLQDNDMKKLADQRRKEKMEDKMARQRVKDKIARDREERAQKFGGGGPPSTAAAAPEPALPSPSSPTSQGPPPTKKEYDESRIQVRMLDGSTITAVFKAQEPLAAVRVYVQMNGNTPEGQDFTLLSPYPRHVYTELDMEKPLKELGLVPSAVLVVAKK